MTSERVGQIGQIGQGARQAGSERLWASDSESVSVSVNRRNAAQERAEALGCG